MPIKGNRQCHMISYFPSGEVQIKEEMCSYGHCYNFIRCDDRTTGSKGRMYMAGDDRTTGSKGGMYMAGDGESHDSDSPSCDRQDSDDEEEDEKEYVLSDMEENQLFAHTEFANTVNDGCLIAIYSNAKVIEKKIKDTNITDNNEHCIPAGTYYMVCYYLEKTFEKFGQGNIKYTLTEKQSVSVTYNQVLYPGFLITPDLELSIEDYQWLSEIGLTMIGRPRY